MTVDLGDGYVDADAMLVLVNSHAEFTYTSDDGFYAEPWERPPSISAPRRDPRGGAPR